MANFMEGLTGLEHSSRRTAPARVLGVADTALRTADPGYLGRSLATGKLAQIGDGVGIIAAQSIGEPGTQRISIGPASLSGRRG